MPSHTSARDISAIGKYLVEFEQYLLVPEVTYPEEIYIRLDNSGGKTEIRVTKTEDPPLRTILGDTYSTGQVNFMTSSKAYAIFPLPTFLQYKTYALNVLDDACWSTLAKYTQRGWRTQDVLWEEEESPYHPIRKLRRIGDHSTWRIPLDMTNMEKCSMPNEVFEKAEFGMVLSSDGHPDTELNYTIEMEIFSAFTLRYQYMFTANDDDFWNNMVEDRTDRLTNIERMKLDEKRRFSFDNAALHAIRSSPVPIKSSDVPNTWTYYDDELPKWYEAWKEKQRKKSLGIDKFKDSDLWRVD
ncbi:hypothetical protein MMC32_001381 [Xylographa parallela]|nr:hypothetical protein [Xylographa parallela]